nr:caspase family protein [uncultured Roseibium sp.]
MKIKRLFSLFTLLFALLPLPASADWDKALLIGVGSYPYLEDSDLIGPPNDVAKFERYLTGTVGITSADIRILIDEEATKDAILSSIKTWLKQNTAAGDRVLVYFSGHGSYVTDTDGDEDDGRDETILPYDTGRGGGSSGMITDDELSNALEALSGRDVVLIADSCHSGTISRFFDPSLNEETRSRFYHNPDARVSSPLIPTELTPSLADGRSAGFTHFSLSAAAANQLAWETGGEGIFTGLLLEALETSKADKNGNGIVTVAEVLSYVRPQTEAWCERVSSCQTMGFTPSSDPIAPEFVLAGVRQTGDTPVETITDIVPENNDMGFQLSIEPSATSRVGDVNRFRVSSDRDGFLLLFDLSSTGELTLLFPKMDYANPYEKGTIKAGVPVLVPDPNWGIAFEVTAPGEGHLLSIVVDQKIDPQQILKGLQSFVPQSLSNAETTLQQIAEQLLAPAVNGRSTIDAGGRNIEYAIVAPPKWSAGVTPYKHIR